MIFLDDIGDDTFPVSVFCAGVKAWTESSEKDQRETTTSTTARVIFKSGDALHELAKCGFMRSCQALDNLPNRLLS